jgi:hypothetical protein
MDCRRLEDELSDLALGESPTAEQRDHLVRCSACGARLEQRRQSVARVDDLLSEALRVEPSPALMARVRSRLAAPPMRRAARLWVPALVTALVLCVAGLAVVNRKPSEPSAQPTVATAPRPVVTVLDRRLQTSAPEGPARERTARSSRAHVVERNAPQILVRPGQTRALARLVRAINRQAQAPGYVLVEPPGQDQVTEESPGVDIRPLVVPPLQSASLPPPDVAFEEPTNL